MQRTTFSIGAWMSNARVSSSESLKKCVKNSVEDKRLNETTNPFSPVRLEANSQSSCINGLLSRYFLAFALWCVATLNEPLLSESTALNSSLIVAVVSFFILLTLSFAFVSSETLAVVELCWFPMGILAIAVLYFNALFPQFDEGSIVDKCLQWSIVLVAMLASLFYIFACNLSGRFRFHNKKLFFAFCFCWLPQVLIAALAHFIIQVVR